LDIMNELENARKPRHPVRVVARMTGLSAHVLRAWERRYAVVEPTRTEGGQRLYSDKDVRRLRLLREATQAGHPISRLVPLSDLELAELAGSQSSGGGAAGTQSTRTEQLRAEMIQHAQQLDARRLQAALTRAAATMRASEFVAEIAAPMLKTVGERWHKGEMRPLEEHIVSVGVRRVLLYLMDMFDPDPAAPTIVIGTLSDELHEFGAMMAGVIAAEEGWRVVFLGPSLPAEEIAAAAIRSNARVTAISTIYSPAVDRTLASLTQLGERLRGRSQLITGGTALEPHAARIGELGGRHVNDFDELRMLVRVEHNAA
jgi:DNA-binding transcriptional MerR regulator/methylmalonyl-CoA mutase cobalamin-binding subunit